MTLHLFLALKSLLRSRLSLVLLVLAVTAGVAFQIPNAANIRGYTAELLRQGVARATGHVIATSRDTTPLAHVAKKTAAVARLPFVRAVTTRVVHAGVVFRGERYQAARVVGIDAAAEDRAAGFCGQLERGSCNRAGKPGQALVGRRLAEQLGLRVGQRIRVTLPYQDLGEIEHAKVTLRVAGVLRGTGGFQADHDLFLPRAQLARVLGFKDEASRISVFVDDHRRAERYAARIAPLLRPARVEAWWAANPFVASAIDGNRALAAISMTMVIVAVGIPVLALLYIHVLSERRQIATLAALGFTRGSLFWIYLCQAALVGLLGAGLGLLGGLGLCALFDAHPIFAYSGFTVRPELDAQVLLLPALVLLLVTLAAGIAPAVRASRANPALELREE